MKAAGGSFRTRGGNTTRRPAQLEKTAFEVEASAQNATFRLGTLYVTDHPFHTSLPVDADAGTGTDRLSCLGTLTWNV